MVSRKGLADPAPRQYPLEFRDDPGRPSYFRSTSLAIAMPQRCGLASGCTHARLRHAGFQVENAST